MAEQAPSKQSKGGQARAGKLSPAERSRIASIAAQRRWANRAAEPSTTRQIRLPDSTWSALAAEAEARKITVNALVHEKVKAPAGAQPTPARTSSRDVDEEFSPARIKATTREHVIHVSKSAGTFPVQIGPTQRKPGTLLKTDRKR